MKRNWLHDPGSRSRKRARHRSAFFVPPREVRRHIAHARHARCAHVWAWGDSNSQVLRHTLLRRTRIPIPPHARLATQRGRRGHSILSAGQNKRRSRKLPLLSPSSMIMVGEIANPARTDLGHVESCAMADPDRHRHVVIGSRPRIARRPKQLSRHPCRCASSLKRDLADVFIDIEKAELPDEVFRCRH